MIEAVGAVGYVMSVRLPERRGAGCGGPTTPMSGAPACGGSYRGGLGAADHRSGYVRVRAAGGAPGPRRRWPPRRSCGRGAISTGRSWKRTAARRDEHGHPRQPGHPGGLALFPSGPWGRAVPCSSRRGAAIVMFVLLGPLLGGAGQGGRLPGRSPGLLELGRAGSEKGAARRGVDGPCPSRRSRWGNRVEVVPGGRVSRGTGW